MKTDLQAQEQYAQEQIRLSPPFKNAWTIEVDRLRAENKKLIEAAREAARVLSHIKDCTIANPLGYVPYSAYNQAYSKIKTVLAKVGVQP